MDVFPKFIIEDLEEDGICLLLGKVTYHKHLAHNIKNVKGGGGFSMDREKMEIVLFGESYDFGRASMEDLIYCVQRKRCFTSWTLVNNLSLEFRFFWKNPDGELIDLQESK